MNRLRRRWLLAAGGLGLVPALRAQPEAQLYVVEIRTGPAWDPARLPHEQAHFAAHSAHLARLRERGVLRMGARYADKGLLVLAAPGEAEAHALMTGDPSIAAGVFRYELHLFRVFYGGELAAALARPTLQLADGAPHATLPFERVDNRLFVQATVNGQGPYRFVFDTGGSNILDTDVTRALGLRLHDGFEMSGAGAGTLAARRTQVARVEVGPVRMRDVRFVAMSLQDLRTHVGFDRLDGLIGHEVLRRFVVSLDFAAGRCTLAEPDAAPGPPPGATVLPLEFMGNVPVVQGHVDGRPARIAIDSGDRSSLTLFTPFVEEHDLRRVYARRFEALTGWGVGGPLHADVTRVQTLGLGPLSLSGITARMPTGRGGVFASREVQASVGTGVLRRLDVGFDYGRRRLWLAPNAQHARPDPVDHSGLWLSRGDGGVVVAHVSRGSAAERANLQSGDFVQAIDGRTTAGLDLPALRQRWAEHGPGLAAVLTVVTGQGPRERRLLVTDRFAEAAPTLR